MRVVPVILTLEPGMTMIESCCRQIDLHQLDGRRQGH